MLKIGYLWIVAQGRFGKGKIPGYSKIIKKGKIPGYRKIIKKGKYPGL